MSKDKTAKLYLEDGTVLEGTSFGAEGKTIGEIVFNTGMTGYQEILTDPSYYGQLVVMTYPLIGNYGINYEDFESVKPNLFGFIVKEYAEYPSHWRQKQTLGTFLKENGIVGIAGVDTRMLTKRIREKGTMKALITTDNISLEQALKLLNSPLSNEQVKQVTCKESFTIPGRGPKVILIDYGYKQGILRELVERNCEVIVVPYDTPLSEIEKLHPDGVLLSNGPGNPKDLPEAINVIKGIQQNNTPLFGICLGHQLFALANGADTEKLLFGHRGSNHPVKELATNKVFMTSQNHGYTVKDLSIKNSNLQITHLAVNDGTIEGLSHQNIPAFSVQYHPEASPGPQDNSYLFDNFIQLMHNKNSKEEKVHA